jgi:plasmid stabilization system protein ParE
MNVIVRPQFYLDIEEEVHWLFQNAGGEIAQRWHHALWQTVEMLKAHPQAGRVRKDLKQPGIRSWRINGFPRWLVFYSADKKLALCRVRSGFMDLTRLEMRS